MSAPPGRLVPVRAAGGIRVNAGAARTIRTERRGRRADDVPLTRDARNPAAPGGAAGLRTDGSGEGQRPARLTAEMTAFREARVVLASVPMPHRTRPSIAHSMYEAATAEAPSLIVCSV